MGAVNLFAVLGGVVALLRGQTGCGLGRLAPSTRHAYASRFAVEAVVLCTVEGAGEAGKDALIGTAGVACGQHVG